MKGHSESIWMCPECTKDIKQTTTYSDIACHGIPICPECGEDMSFVSEEWIEEDVNMYAAVGSTGGFKP